MDFKNFEVPYKVNSAYKKRTAYFSMEFAIDQSLKIYSGGLGFLAGSHMRSAYNLRQNLIGIGILWKLGYYDQSRNQDQTLKPIWIEKQYNFLKDTGIKYKIAVHDSPVWVKVWYLAPEVFNTAPIFLLSTDTEENDHVSKTISHRLYDNNESTKLAQYILLGKGGAKLLEKLNFDSEVYHLNEAHGLPAAFYMLNKYKGDVEKVKEKFVFTTHTPVDAGNEVHDINLCKEMSYFSGYSIGSVNTIVGTSNGSFNHSLCALKISRKANGVSKLHGKVANKMWGHYDGISPITSITNAQEFKYWADEELYSDLDQEKDEAFDERKKEMKKQLFDIVSDQTGKQFDPTVFTIVWARRFAGYKRADLLMWEKERFDQLLNNTKYPIQIIWAGKPYPMDYASITTFDGLVNESKQHGNMAVLTGYELTLSRALKKGADLWLNNPRVHREASGTSGMTAAMNGTVNLSTNDGWIPEFIKPGVNGFVVPTADYDNMSTKEIDDYDLKSLYDLLENEILPMYYEDQAKWRNIAKTAMREIKEPFNSDRMAAEYYEKMYYPQD